MSYQCAHIHHGHGVPPTAYLPGPSGALVYLKGIRIPWRGVCLPRGPLDKRQAYTLVKCVGDPDPVDASPRPSPKLISEPSEEAAHE
ncbi:hypothetical protein BHE74_00011750 [Ensete ventricosum]|nr:hypothetical protein BHE74_00011750 [Ensete ventricosum]